LDYGRNQGLAQCWALVKSKNDFNILVANDEPKPSGTHWEIYSYSGSGLFSVYLPGCSPAIEMAPLPAGPLTTLYNLTFVVNQRPAFIKGAD
jgi:hypothetical protein